MSRRGAYAHSEAVPAAPFVAWLKRCIKSLEHDQTLTVKGGKKRVRQALAYELGITERTLYRYEHSLNADSRPVDTFVRAKVEAMLGHAGVELEDIYPAEVIYPDFDPDPPLEPEVWCPTCQETTTPIRGICPWCETQAVAA